MNNALIVSGIGKNVVFFKEMIARSSCKDIVSAENCGAARRLLACRDFDLCVVNTPLPDEFGDVLALDAAENSPTQVILIVAAELFDEVSESVEDYGVLAISKPINKGLFWNALKLANAAHIRISAMKDENRRLLRKIEDMRIIERAKCVLIEFSGMTEPEAHKYIERQAMNRRATKRATAEEILRAYGL